VRVFSDYAVAYGGPSSCAEALAQGNGINFARVWRAQPFPKVMAKPELAVYSSLRRGWFFGSERFREKLLKMLAKRPGRIEKANGYHGAQLHDYAERRAHGLIRAALEQFGTDLAS
jgi:hypothetical protein